MDKAVLEFAGVTTKLVKEENITIRELTSKEFSNLSPTLIEALHDNIYIAGGSVMNIMREESNQEDIKDYDVFCRDRGYLTDAISMLGNIFENAAEKRTANATIVRDKDNGADAWFEVIHSKVGTPYEVLSMFDLDVCQGAIFSIFENLENKYFFIGFENFNKATASFTSEEHINSSYALSRMTRYINKGFEFTESSINKVMLSWFKNTAYLHKIMSFDEFVDNFETIDEATHLNETSFESMDEKNFVNECQVIALDLSLKSVFTDEYKERIDQIERAIQSHFEEIGISKMLIDLLNMTLYAGSISTDNEKLSGLHFGSIRNSVFQDTLIAKALINGYKNTSEFISGKMSDSEILDYKTKAVIFIVKLHESIYDSCVIMPYESWMEASKNFDPNFDYGLMVLLHEHEAVKNTKVHFFSDDNMLTF